MKTAEITINYRPLEGFDKMVRVATSADIVPFLRKIWSDRIDHIEEFLVILLNRSNRVIGFKKVSMGGVTGCLVDAKIVFQAALMTNATSIILTHNHPSGNTQPSAEDIAITKKIKQGGMLLEIMTIDHIILTSDGFFSFADEGMM